MQNSVCASRCNLELLSLIYNFINIKISKYSISFPPYNLSLFITTIIMSNLILSRLLQQQCRSSAFGLLSSRATSNFTMTSTQNTTVNKEFWKKNKELERPMSPHLSIYKPQLTSTLSILNRGTGLAVSAVLYAGGIGALFCTNTSFPEIIQLVQQNVPHFLIISTKTALGGCMIYHTLAGIRHLLWDVGYGFNIKHLYLSGYIVVALTAIGTAIVFIKG